MKSNYGLLVLFTLLTISCSKEEKLQTQTVLFEAKGTGNVDYIIHSDNCGNNFTNCYTEVIFENPSFPFVAKVEDYYSDLINIKVIVANESQKENISELKITVDEKVHVLRKVDFNWWDDSPYGMQLEFSISK